MTHTRKKGEEAVGAPTTSSASIQSIDRQPEQQLMKRQRLKTKYFPSKIISSEVILSQMAATDGIPFHDAFVNLFTGECYFHIFSYRIFDSMVK